MTPSSISSGMTSSSIAPPGLPPNTMASNQFSEQETGQSFLTQYPGMTALGNQALSHSLGGQVLSHSLGGQGLSQFASTPFSGMSQTGVGGLERLSQLGQQQQQQQQGQQQQFQAGGGTEGSQPNSGPPTPAPTGKSSAAIRQDQL